MSEKVSDCSLLIRNSQLPALLGISNKSVRRLLDDPGFPKPRRLGPGLLMFVRSEIEAWVNGQAAEEEPAQTE